jgi:activator of HSP90 ATPase
MLKIVQQSTQLPATPEALYAMYLDPLQHAAITGSPVVRIAPTEGAKFWAFDGRIHGRVLALTAGRQIVQSWRSFEWWTEDPDGTLVLTFSPDIGGSRIESALVNAPGHLSTNYWKIAHALLGPLAGPSCALSLLLLIGARMTEA